MANGNGGGGVATVVRAKPGAADKAVAQRNTKTHDMIKKLANAATWRGICGWPLPGKSLTGDPVTVATALAALIAGSVDLFQQAITAQQAQPGTLYGTLGTFQFGQAPWNNFLNSNARPFNPLYPDSGGIYLGQLSDTVPGIYSAIAENCIFTLNQNQNPSFYQPVITLPPGSRFVRIPATTVDNTTVITEGLGEASAHGLYKFREDEEWEVETQLGLVMSATKPLQNYLATLTTQNIPAAGTLIGWLGYGYQLRPLGTKI